MSIVINIGQSKHYQVDFLDFLRQILFRFSFLNICYLKCDEPIIITPIHFKFQPDPPCLKGFQWVSLQDSGGHTGTNLKFLCIQQSDAALFCENYTKLYFDAKHFKKGLNSGGEIFGALFFQKNSFWSILDAALIF